MSRRSLIAGFFFALALSVLTALPVLAQQQDNSQSPPQSPPAQPAKPAPPKKDQPKKSTADENPFPQAQSEAAAHQAQQQAPGSSPDAPQPQATPPTAPQNKSSDQNSFPEAQSEKAAHEAQQPANSAPAPNPPDDADFSSSHVKGLEMPTTNEQPPANLPASPLPWNPKLARKDAEIGDYYMESGNWQGAYPRFLEANRSDPGNAEAVFGLAESARHLHKPDEALRNYRLYLSALPNGPHAKEVRKALKEMGAAPPA